MVRLEASRRRLTSTGVPGSIGRIGGVRSNAWI